MTSSRIEIVVKAFKRVTSKLPGGVYAILFTFAKDLTTIRKALILAAILFIAGGVIGWIGTGAMQKLIEQQLQGLSNISKDLKESDHPQWSFSNLYS